MQIVLKNKNNKQYRTFIYTYIPYKIRVLGSKRSVSKLELIDKEFNINSNRILTIALNSLKVTESPESFRITFDKNKKIDGRNIADWINLITFGNRSVKGYSLVYNIFDYIASHINELYKEWLSIHGY